MSVVEVWQIGLARDAELVQRLRSVLSDDERERAARLATPEPWIVARAGLRIALAARLGCVPGELAFAAGAHGKPELPGQRLRFNLSHSGERAVVALADRLEVGVDVERTNRRSQAVERTLTDGERAALTGDDRHRALLQVWCRKEALAKAMGGGLGWAPESFDTSRPDGYALADLELPEGYVGAVAVEGDRADVVLYELAL